MKAVVLEIKDGVAAVLREDGTVEKIKRGCAVGQTIELGETRGRVITLRRFGAAAAAAVLVAALLGGTHLYYNAYACSYVSLDAEPSIEYALNRMDRVISVSALNDEGQEVVAELNDSGVKNKTITEAVSDTLNILRGSGALDGGVLLSVSSDNGSRADTLYAAVEQAVGGDEGAKIVTATMDDRDAAAAQGISAGRYEAIKSVKNSAAPVESGDVDAYRDVPVGDLIGGDQTSGAKSDDTQTSGSSSSAASGSGGAETKSASESGSAGTSFSGDAVSRDPSPAPAQPADGGSASGNGTSSGGANDASQPPVLSGPQPAAPGGGSPAEPGAGK